MKITKLMLAAFSLLLVTACSHKSTGSGDGMGSGYSSACEELERKKQDRIYFAFDSSAISMESKEILAKQAEFMKSHPDLNFIVEGHCDERGTREYNMALGERRANAAKNHLVSLGIEPSRLTVISYGKERPAVMGSDEAAWSLNRRAVTVVKQ